MREPIGPRGTAAIIGPYRIQLGSFRSPNELVRKWKAIKKKYRTIFKGKALIVEKVNLGRKRGVFYRLQTGPFRSPTAAKALCIKIGRRKSGCIVVRS